MAQRLSVKRPLPDEGGWLCEACGKYSIRESDHTRHTRRCTKDDQRSSNIWNKNTSNIRKLGDAFRNKRGRYKGSQVVVESRCEQLSTSENKWARYRSLYSTNHTSGTEGSKTATQLSPLVSNSSTLSSPLQHPLVLSQPDPESFGSDVIIPEAEPPATDRAVGKRTSKPSQKIRAIYEGAAVADQLPEGPAQLESSLSTVITPSMRRVVLHVSEKICTARNKFGLSREYRRRPTAIPDTDRSWRTLIADHCAPSPKRKKRSIADIIYPYPNVSSFLYNKFWKSHLHASDRARDDFCTTVLADARFKVSDLQGVNFRALEKQISDDVQSPWGSNGWKRSTLVLEIPTGIKATKASQRADASARASAKRNDEVDPDAELTPTHKIIIPDIRTASMTHLLRETITENPVFHEAHIHGFKETWLPPYKDKVPERVWGELYTSDAFLQAERDLLASAPEENCDLPRAIWAYMLWSDSTHLAQFGQAKAWPIYAHDGNISKYTRCKPSSGTVHHVGYIPPLPDTFAADLKRFGITPTPALLAHCKRDLFHGVWRLLLDEEFREAYKHGVVVTCKDGIQRRIYPRIFTYSADYPEKVLIATIRDMGGCPCPRCLVKKEDLGKVGTTQDATDRVQRTRKDDQDFRDKVSGARRAVYKEGYVVNSETVDNILKAESLVPTENAFSAFFQDFRFSVFLMLVVDLMHEFELGVWKALLTHLIRMLCSLGAAKVQEFNDRFFQVAPFGKSTIRRFSSNVSELKKLAARDYEDILQCCIPCFEGMFGENDASIQELLYLGSYWHSLAKLRMHTETTLKVFENVTVLFAKSLRLFAQVTCLEFKTVETDAEYSARCRAATRRAAMQAATRYDMTRSDSDSMSIGAGGKRAKTFNLTTYKLHSLGDYVATIRMFGTTDSYSTQSGELEHRVVKRRYAQSNRRGFIDQFVKMDVLETIHERMNEELEAAGVDASPVGMSDPLASASRSGSATLVPAGDAGDRNNDQAVTDDNLADHHYIALDENTKIHLQTWLDHPNNRNDPAYKNFESKLKRHLLARRHGSADIGDEPSYTSEDLHKIIIKNNMIFSHATASFHYTSYDVRRDSDSINVNGLRRDVMVRANNDPIPDAFRQHPFWYARVFGIYHANVHYGRNPVSERVEFLFVRWFGIDSEWVGGPATRKLDRIGFVPEDDPSGAFGFLDPRLVLRAAHLIPAFAHGRSVNLLRPSKLRDSPMKGDWVYYYVSRFVDRDMMMRYLGWGVGHLNPPDFPHEADDLNASHDDRQLSDPCLPSDHAFVKASTSDMDAGNAEGEGMLADETLAGFQDEDGGSDDGDPREFEY